MKHEAVVSDRRLDKPYLQFWLRRVSQHLWLNFSTLKHSKLLNPSIHAWLQGFEISDRSITCPLFKTLFEFAGRKGWFRFAAEEYEPQEKSGGQLRLVPRPVRETPAHSPERVTDGGMEEEARGRGKVCVRRGQTLWAVKERAVKGDTLQQFQDRWKIQTSGAIRRHFDRKKCQRSSSFGR